MTEREEMKELIKKRGSYKGRLTVFSTYLNGLDKTLGQSEVCELQLRVNRIESLYDQYDEVQLRIECLVDDVDSQVIERSDFESSFYKFLAKAQNILTRNCKKSDEGSEKGSSRASNHKLVKLPTIKLPTFSGSYDNWLEFHDTFCSLIHSNDDIDDINKFHYLRASLDGTAALVIQSIEFSTKNYQVAWELLCERFDNKRLLIQNHVTALFNIEPMIRESSDSIKRIIDQLNKNLRALESLGEPTKHWDTLLIHIVTLKLDAKTFREWEEFKGRLDKDNRITLSQFCDFMRSRADLIETLELSRHKQQTSNNKIVKLKSMVGQSVNNLHTQQHTRAQCDSVSTNSCRKCNGSHSLQNCPQFLTLSTNERLQLLPTLKVCYNCFKPGHYANRCKSNGCKLCKRKHHTLIHVADFKRKSTFLYTDGAQKPSTESTSTNESCSNVSNNVSLSCVATSRSANDAVLLSTVLVKLYDSNNQHHVVRAVLDSGSTSCLMTDSLYRRLKLPYYKVDKSVVGINNSVSHICKMVHVPMKSLGENYSTKLFCFVLPSITDCIPSRQIDISDMNIPSDICLADPNFHTPSAVDLILGADIFWDLLGPRSIKLGDGNPILYETSLGWIVSGPINGGHVSNSSHQIKCNFTNVNNYSEPLHDDLQIQLTRFWQLEEVTIKSSYYSTEEQLCEQHFNENTTRLEDGRFCVRIPLKQSQAVLGDSLQRAKHCLLSLERRTKNQPEFRKGYCDFMSEYISLGHMSESKLNPETVNYFIPHHGILRLSSSTTKLRVVFNASAPTSSRVSLNDIQMVGPTIQEDLLSILLRFRQHRYILAADIEKMYRQVSVHPDDRHLQQILWRDDVSSPLKVYRLNTVTYGTSSAPFLAIRCLKQVGIECDDAKIAEIITHDFYVDDLLTGGDTIADIMNIKERVTAALASACMPLTKFKSNVPQLMSDSQSSIDLNIGFKEPSKTLGLGWYSEADELAFSVDTTSSDNITKRSILSVIAQIFDPLGIVTPCVILMKIILQKLWLHKLSWDDSVPPEIHNQWLQIIKGLPDLNNVRVPRTVICDSPIHLDLHIFSDASLSAYGACVYVRSINVNGGILVRLLMAKSRVAPIKPVTIPRLELCGALVGACLYEKVVSSLRAKIRHTTFWTDSMVVLGWLKILPSKLQPFVRNRIAAIHEKTEHCLWRYVPTKENPADLISRGVEPSLIQSSELWWSGPEYLMQSLSHWPSTPGTIEKLPEMKPEVTLYVTTEVNNNFIEFNRFSNFSRLKRSVAYVLRFVAICKRQTIPSKHISADELQDALNLLIRLSQNDSFPEYKLLLQDKTLPTKSALLKFNVFLDAQKLMRVGGRLENSDYCYEKKHPVLIQSTHPFTKLLFRFEHVKLMHAGPQLLLATIRENYWPIGGRNLARLCYRQCVLCNRMKGKTVTPLMGNLPKNRVSPSYPFECVGIDYAGPILAANRQGRGCRLVKVYISIFICFTTKAIHTELVGDLTSNTFLSALNRFISRRGKPKHIYSDNGTSFVGAYNDIGKFLKNNCSLLSESAANEGIRFHFSPPYSPHFGGLWEAGVKSIKFHLHRVLGNCHFTYEELNTVLVQIEALLNSRPLSPISSDPDDMTPLTPGHFLIGRPLTALPNPNYEDESTSRLNRYQRIEQIRQHFWSRWSKEYIAELQKRVKWRSGANQLQNNTLVVLKEDHLPPLRWKMGRIVAVHPGKDGVNRVADVKTANGTIRRAFSKICPLLQDNE